MRYRAAPQLPFQSENARVSASLRPPVEPLGDLLKRADGTKIAAVRAGLAAQPVSDLIASFQSRFRDNRLTVLLIAEELASRGVPPVFWHDPRWPKPFSAVQQFDLLTYDLRYLQHEYKASSWRVRVKAFAQMMEGRQPEARFHESVEWIWNGDKDWWWIVGRLAIPELRQGGCMFLGRAAVKRDREQFAAKRERVYKAIEADVAASRTTSMYGRDEKKATIKRRVTLWWIAELTGWGRPTDVSRIYTLLTSESISRQVVGNQLEAIKAVLLEAGIVKGRKARLQVTV